MYLPIDPRKDLVDGRRTTELDKDLERGYGGANLIPSQSRSSTIAARDELDTAREDSILEDARNEKAEESPPDGGYGWVVVGCVFWLAASTWGVNSSYAVFLAYFLRTDRFPGATPLKFAFIGGLSVSMALLVAPLGTYLSWRYGFRPVMLFGSLLNGGSFIAASFATELWQLFLAQGLCFGIGIGLLFVCSIGIPSQWFRAKRGIANGITTAGSGAGGIAFLLGSSAMIQNLGLAWAYRITGIIAITINIITTLLLRDRNRHVLPYMRAFDIKIFTSYEYILVMAWATFSMLRYIVTLFSLVDYAQAVPHLDAHRASIVGAMFSLGMLFGRPMVGFVSDKLGRINVTIGATVLCSLTCFVWWSFAESFASTLTFALFNGAVSGTVWAMSASVTAEVVGLRDLPSALNLLWISLVPAATFSSVIGLALRRSGTMPEYQTVTCFAGTMFAIAAIILVFLRGWKMDEREAIARRRASQPAAGGTLGHLQTPSAQERRDAGKSSWGVRGWYSAGNV